jgi:hypothetical protein
MKIGEYYYYITDKGTIGKSKWLNSYRDYYRQKKGIFKNYKECKICFDTIKMSITEQ